MSLAIQFLGSPQFQLDNVPVTASRRAVVALMAYLTVTELEHPGQRFSRDSLAELFWTDYDLAKGLANLRHTLWEVTQFIGEGWVLAEHETITLNPKADITLDVGQFRALLVQASRQSDPALRTPLLVEAVKLYRGDFLSGFSLKESPGFNEWVLAQGEALRRAFASGLERLVDDFEAVGELLLALPYAQQLVALEPFHEPAQRTLIRLYALTDQQNAAIQHYKALEKLLRKELNLDPQPETRELYKKIRRGGIQPGFVEKKSPSLEKILPKHNLPVHLTTFVGREREQEQIGQLLAHNRLVTLVGAGGIGKTRLAIKAGGQLLELYRDGVWFVGFEAILDPDLMPQTVASSLGIAELPDQPVIETLIREVRGRSLLLIFDNCEHLLDACAGLAENLLKNCPSVRILATSREALRLEGESFYPVPALEIPALQDQPALEAFPRYEAIRLFLERARLVVPGFELTNVNVETVANICSRLDGIPLAIELAAARSDIFTPEEILNQLNRSFDFLVSQTRSLLPRHQTMHASIDWGWNLLTDSERMFMRHLSVFVGEWTLRAAQALGLKDSLERTSALWKRSFVVVRQQAGYETRYRFHEVVRSFALEKLVEAGEEAALRDRHLDYFLELARQFEPALRGVDQELWLERLLIERDNIRAALEWAARTHVQAGLYLSNRLRTFWENYEFREEARWLLML
jgi:predicted ATPase/DNA-binding SARP family transcriptional activator